ncbi:hypothetical protein CcCBS67573_g10507 [Chytriomyces confervae]|uniref:Uncharacterized protein n=1 Tax=Chytriomyces confervae TaxID=246404 RepID=A0A507CTJ8_9FUNG|nr:hypothetical protein CcCBS67573_g10507 [Chytriomyces confervae]
MSSARLTGPIPGSFGNMINLVELRLQMNKLLGTVLVIACNSRPSNAKRINFRRPTTCNASAERIEMGDNQLTPIVDIDSDRTSGYIYPFPSVSLDLQSPNAGSNQLQEDSFADTIDSDSMFTSRLGLSRTQLSRKLPNCSKKSATHSPQRQQSRWSVSHRNWRLRKIGKRR